MRLTKLMNIPPVGVGLGEFKIFIKVDRVIPHSNGTILSAPFWGTLIQIIVISMGLLKIILKHP